MKTSTKRVIEEVNQRLRGFVRGVSPHSAAVLAVIVLSGLLGSYLLTSSQAATPVASNEAENGTVSSAASTITDSTASGSGAVKFGSGTNPNCTPIENIPASFPNNCNTGYTNAPDYDPSKMHSCSGPITSNSTYNFCIFTGLDIGNQGTAQTQPSLTQISGITFHGCLFKGTSVDGALVNLFGVDNATFDYSTFQPNATFVPNTQVAHNTSYQYGVNAGGSYFAVAKAYTVTNSDFWGFGNAIDTVGSTQAKPQVFRNNWFHDAANDGNGDYHTDGIGAEGGGASGSYVVIDHNTIVSPGNTNAIAFQQGSYSNFTITSNYVSGFGNIVAVWAPAPNTTFTGNTWGTNLQQVYESLYPQSFWTSSGSYWHNNKIHWVNNIYQSYQAGDANKTGLITSADDGKFWTPNGITTTDYQ